MGGLECAAVSSGVVALDTESREEVPPPNMDTFSARSNPLVFPLPLSLLLEDIQINKRYFYYITFKHDNFNNDILRSYFISFYITIIHCR